MWTYKKLFNIYYLMITDMGRVCLN